MPSSTPAAALNPNDPRYVPASYNPADYDRPSVTVDVVLFACHAGTLHVLLVRRRRWPYEGYWAIPGGFVRMDESLETAARRELAEETGVGDLHLEQLHTFGEPGRDPRTRVISVAYLALAGPGAAVQLSAGDDAAEARWWAMDSLPSLAFDHDRILRCALQRLRWRLEHTAIGYLLLPETFTLAELRAAYEAVLDEKLDKRQFRHRMLAAGVIEQVPAQRMGGAQRAARSYHYNPAAVAQEQARWCLPEKLFEKPQIVSAETAERRPERLGSAPFLRFCDST